jgi:hypothetical protein
LDENVHLLCFRYESDKGADRKTRMKLGIVVVYFVKRENEALLDLHLKQIGKHTGVPYAIYGSANRLLPEFRTKLERHPKAKICDCPATSLRGDDEQVFYLEHLIEEAIDDGASHIATLHVDSFPIRSGWADALAEKLSESRVFAAPYYGNYTACLFFQRDFYFKYRPKFRLSENELSSEPYRRFCKAFPHIPHAGIGYFFKAHLEGLSWHPLLETNRGNSKFIFISSIYDDLIFHLNGAAFDKNEPAGATRLIQIKKWGWRHVWAPILRILLLTKLQQQLLGAKRLIIPRHLMSLAWKHFGFPMFYRPIHWHERQQLLEDPESYVDYLRTGKRRK